MLSKSKRKVIRKMFNMSVFLKSDDYYNLSGWAIFDIYLEELLYSDDLSLKNYRRYSELFKKMT